MNEKKNVNKLTDKAEDHAVASPDEGTSEKITGVYDRPAML